MAIRQIPYEIHTFEQLGLPPICRDLIAKNQGLILVTGPTGSGKSTTLATMVDTINTQRKGHIITIEDPIEFVHQHKNCIVNQREVHSDTHSFPAALKYVLRQDPDVILIGEMRDRETIGAALTIAETGHLAMATLHTNSTFETINRIVDVFPASQQNQVRAQLAFSLSGCIDAATHSEGAGRRPGPGHGDHGLHPRHQGHDPRRQGTPDLRSDAGRAEARHADHEPVPLPGRHEQVDHHGAGPRPHHRRRRTRTDAR